MLFIEATWAATEAVDERDPGGRVVHRTERTDGAITKEIWATWTRDGRPLTRREVGGAVVDETWTYDRFGRETEHAVTRDGVMVKREATTWRNGKLFTRSQLDGTTVWFTWAVDGTPASTKTTAADGTILDQTVVVPGGTTPWVVAGDLGLSGDTDVRSLGFGLGFSVERKPVPSRYGVDPFELRVAAGWQFSRLAGVTANDQQSLRVGADWNEVWGRWTPFLYADGTRNPAANLLWDVTVSPFGMKVNLVRRPAFGLDVSASLPYELRNVEGGCAFPTDDGKCRPGAWRGSLRVRASFFGHLRETIEVLPSLLPASGNLWTGFVDEGVVRSTTTLELPINRILSWKQSILLVRDPRLVAQADCAATPDSALCRGVSAETTAALSVRWAR